MKDWRAPLWADLTAATEGAASDLARFLTPDSRWRVAHPVGDLIGPRAVAEGWLAPLRAAIPARSRRDLIVMGGESGTGSGRWLATLGHVAGDMVAPLFGVPPSGKLVFLRVGEFYRLDESGRVAEAVVLPDLLDLMRQVGRFPLPMRLGTEMLFPGPQTHDGVLPGAPERTEASLRQVSDMLRDLRDYDPETFVSTGQFGEGGYWAPNMMWYGPGGIGSNTGYLGFQRDHREAFLTAFPDRVGGNHFARFADGAYIASGGWPSMTMTWARPYMGQAPDGGPHTLRVMDFWRADAAGRLAENWVLLDIVELFHQIGRDLIAECRAMQGPAAA